VPDTLTLDQLVARWKHTTLSERSGAQQHFVDLCEVLGQPRPAAVDQTGETYTFEKGVTTTAGGQGWADVWKRGHFAWEYKGRHKDLTAAYQQLLRYRETSRTRRCSSSATSTASRCTLTSRTP
jgi:hypothetical protein